MDWKKAAEWGFGVLLVLGGLGGLMRAPAAGIIFLLLGIFLIPPARERILDATGFELPTYALAGIILAGLLAGGALLPQNTTLASDDTSTLNESIQEQPQAETQTRNLSALTKENVRFLAYTKDYDLARSDVETVTKVQMRDVRDEGKRISVFFRSSGNYVDSEDVVKTGVQSSYTITRALYEQYDNVESVSTVHREDFQDRYGETKEGTAVRVRISQESADKINWEGMQHRVVSDYTNWIDIADFYKIQSSLCEETDIYPQCKQGTLY